MDNHGSTSTISPEDASPQDEMDYSQAQAAVSRQQRKELMNKVAELRRQADGAKERAKKAQERFEKAVFHLASEKPERLDWYEYPGALPRKQLLEAAKFNTVALHRVMNRVANQKKRKTR